MRPCRHRSTESEAALRQFALEQGVEFDDVDAERLVRTMVDWYRAERADDVDLAADGDMLLFQWGTYDWSQGKWFEFDVTRQFIVADLEDDDAFFQLSWTLRFQPSDLTASLEAGNKWCHHPSEVDDFEAFVLNAPVTDRVRGLTPDQRRLVLDAAG